MKRWLFSGLIVMCADLFIGLHGVVDPREGDWLLEANRVRSRCDLADSLQIFTLFYFVLILVTSKFGDTTATIWWSHAMNRRHHNFAISFLSSETTWKSRCNICTVKYEIVQEEPFPFQVLHLAYTTVLLSIVENVDIQKLHAISLVSLRRDSLCRSNSISNCEMNIDCLSN